MFHCNILGISMRIIQYITQPLHQTSASLKTSKENVYCMYAKIHPKKSHFKVCLKDKSFCVNELRRIMFKYCGGIDIIS